ncbi:hypothetical protein G5I_11879 [Acromyrmex echinatior]|uniref:Uncharacterized protein n=1 Tax=Acromyrmex echinatior TaxID=103372 RepID=F4X0T1_ACREC|nr:hypothetical protein G5I_11879 [Acromyrmex echinatior]
MLQALTALNALSPNRLSEHTLVQPVQEAVSPCSQGSLPSSQHSMLGSVSSLQAITWLATQISECGGHETENVQLWIRGVEQACIKVVIPSWLIGVYEFSRNLSGPSFQFCQTVIRRLHSNFTDHSRDVEPILSKEKNRGVYRT